MAVYEHLRTYQVANVTKHSAALRPTRGRKFWIRFLTQETATTLFKRPLKLGDKVVYKRVSNAVTTFYKPVKIK
jgi:hypothetical protein